MAYPIGLGLRDYDLPAYLSMVFLYDCMLNGPSLLSSSLMFHRHFSSVSFI